LRKAAKRFKGKVKVGKPWNKWTDEELWLKVLGQIAVVGRAEPGERLQHDPKIGRKVSIGKLNGFHSDAALQKYLHEFLVGIAARYVSKKKGWEKDRKARAGVYNFRALMKAGGPKKFFRQVAALPTEKKRIQFLNNRETLQYYGKKGSRDTLIELRLARKCLALDARILGLLKKVGVEIKRGSLDRNYEKIEGELIRKVAKPLGISGGQLDRMLFKNYDRLLEDLKTKKS
jgi:hypothetical protein